VRLYSNPEIKKLEEKKGLFKSETKIDKLKRIENTIRQKQIDILRGILSDPNGSFGYQNNAIQIIGGNFNSRLDDYHGKVNNGYAIFSNNGNNVTPLKIDQKLDPMLQMKIPFGDDINPSTSIEERFYLKKLEIKIHKFDGEKSQLDDCFALEKATSLSEDNKKKLKLCKAKDEIKELEQQLKDNPYDQGLKDKLKNAKERKKQLEYETSVLAKIMKTLNKGRKELKKLDKNRCPYQVKCDRLTTNDIIEIILGVLGNSARSSSNILVRLLRYRLLINVIVGLMLRVRLLINVIVGLILRVRRLYHLDNTYLSIKSPISGGSPDQLQIAVKNLKLSLDMIISKDPSRDQRDELVKLLDEIIEKYNDPGPRISPIKSIMPGKRLKAKRDIISDKTSFSTDDIQSTIDLAKAVLTKLDEVYPRKKVTEKEAKQAIAYILWLIRSGKKSNIQKIKNKTGENISTSIVALAKHKGGSFNTDKCPYAQAPCVSQSNIDEIIEEAKTPPPTATFNKNTKLFKISTIPTRVGSTKGALSDIFSDEIMIKEMLKELDTLKLDSRNEKVKKIQVLLKELFP
jgi:hypothetical protein